MADIKIHSAALRNGPFETRVPLTADKYVVVGEMGVSPDLWPSGGEPAATRMLYLLRAQIED